MKEEQKICRLCPHLVLLLTPLTCYNTVPATTATTKGSVITIFEEPHHQGQHFISVCPFLVFPVPLSFPA